MENTGRIRRPVTPAARRILFGKGCGPGDIEELRCMTQVDQAHLLMLSESGIIPRGRAQKLLAAIERLQDENFISLQNRTATRGLFLLYEDYLIGSEGPEVGGILQTGRSRNDLNATILKIRLRRPYLRMLRECLRLHAVFLRNAEQYAGAVMPLYTHGQAAVPATYGHYLAGVASALTRDFEGLAAIMQFLQSCPLGAGAAAGTSFPIRVERTAELLGFESGPLNSLDAVASRDVPLRLLAAASLYALTLSRIATDLLQWTTAEFNFIRLPDELVGSSSAMPQKRNPFLLEHVQGRASSLIGAFLQSATAMHAVPFTNSIAVGTEAMRPLWAALGDFADMIVLLRLVLRAARPNLDVMMRRAESGFTVATAFAEKLVTQGGLDFRSAHKMIGTAVLETLESGTDSFEESSAKRAADHGISISFHGLGPASVVRTLEFGGGPGPSSLRTCLEYLRKEWSAHCRQKQLHERTWLEAEEKMSRAIREFLSPASLARSSC